MRPLSLETQPRPQGKCWREKRPGDEVAFTHENAFPLPLKCDSLRKCAENAFSFLRNRVRAWKWVPFFFKIRFPTRKLLPAKIRSLFLQNAFPHENILPAFPRESTIFLGNFCIAVEMQFVFFNSLTSSDRPPPTASKMRSLSLENGNTFTAKMRSLPESPEMLPFAPKMRFSAMMCCPRPPICLYLPWKCVPPQKCVIGFSSWKFNFFFHLSLTGNPTF